jgi:hypothetical protein
MELLTITVVNFVLFCCIGRIVEQNKRKFTTVTVNNSIITTKTKESLQQ